MTLARAKDDANAIRLFAAEFEPEFLRLQSAKTTVESSHLATIGRFGSDNETPSRLLFGHDFAEVNRTLISMLALKWLLAGDYKRFTGCQCNASKLTLDSFSKLRNFFLERLHDTDVISSVLVVTVINDIGKDPNLADEIERNTDTSDLNHDEVAFFAAKMGILPSLEKFPRNQREDILLGLDFGSKCNIAQLAQGENVPGSLKAVHKFQSHERGFNIKIMETLLDVAGAGAHVDARCCTQMTEPVFQSYMAAIDALNDFIHGKISSERECYDCVLTTRAILLRQKGFEHLSIEIEEERALL